MWSLFIHRKNCPKQIHKTFLQYSLKFQIVEGNHKISIILIAMKLDKALHWSSPQINGIPNESSLGTKTDIFACK